MRKLSNGMIILLVVLGLLLVWGLIGGNQSQSVGVTCDMGIGDTFCWKWHTNAIGQFQEGVQDLLDR